MVERKQKETNWLTRVQEQSWEPEILISGFVLFALFQIPSLLKDLNLFLNNNSIEIFSQGNVDDTLTAMLTVSNGWLIFGFSTHLFLRSIWVAFIGLSYVYKDGIDFSKLKFQPEYKKGIKKNSDYVEIIHKLEKACSATFAISFLWFLCILGATFAVLVIGGIINILLYFLPSKTSGTDWVDLTLSTIFLVHIFDFVTLGALKRIKYVSKVYYPIYTLISYLTLSPLYRGIYYGFVSNHKWWKVALFMLLFAASSIILVFAMRENRNLINTMVFEVRADKHQLFYGHYENLAVGGAYSRNIILNSDIIEDDVLQVFIVHRTGYEKQSIMKLCDYENRAAQDSVDLDDLKMDCLDQFYDLKIDGELVQSKFLFHKHQKSKQEGLITYLDIAHLDKGMHVLELIYHIWNDEEAKHQPSVRAYVEFYKMRQTASKAANHGEE